MVKYWVSGLLVGAAALAMSGSRPMAADNAAPTFTKDVLPILQKNCQSCHRPGQIAPFSMLTYDTTRPWARSIKNKVEARQMPPWFADKAHGDFANDRSLKDSEIETIARWVDAGAPKGDDKDAPPATQWPDDGWAIKPDIVVRGPEFRVPAHPKSNVIEWTTVVVPSGFTKDTWVTSLEIKPSDLSVTHHICISFRPHTPNAKYYVPNWNDKPRDEDGVELKESVVASRQSGAGGARPANGNAAPGGFSAVGGGFWCYVPGVQVDDYRPFHAGKLIPANSDITFQLHYTPSGKESVDRPMIGFTVSDTPPEKQWVSAQISGAGPTFAIPPNEPNYASPPAEVEFQADAELVEMMPHMHLRGKDMTYHLIYPDGRDEVVLNVPHYDFNWQLVYQPMTPIRIPKGTKLHVEAHYDNSTGNKFNPNPNRTVLPGNMTWEEMMNPFFGFMIDMKTDPGKVLKLARGTRVGDGA
jgi:hypothetical protein